MRALKVWLAIGIWLVGAQVHAQAPVADAAEIVLVGDAGALPELQRIVAELLEREGVASVFRRADQLNADALLAAPDADDRVHVFLTLPSHSVARLYMRGPHGERFLLRELSLRNGPDELGRESIAHVVATSTRALLRAGVGIDREAARADLVREGISVTPTTVQAPEPAQVGSAAPGARWQVALGLRETARWTGSVLQERWAVGAELMLAQQWNSGWLLRQRVTVEQAASQSLDVPELLAFVRATSLRIGLDLGLASGIHRALLGLSLGADLLRITPERARDPSWSLSPPHTSVVPVLRAELGYQLVLRPVYVAVALLCDVSLRRTRFDVSDAGQTQHVASAAWLSPGLSLSLGWHSP